MTIGHAAGPAYQYDDGDVDGPEPAPSWGTGFLTLPPAVRAVPDTRPVDGEMHPWFAERRAELGRPVDPVDDPGYGRCTTADYGHADYGRADYGRADYGRADYRQVDNGHADYGHADYGHADYGHADYGHADYGHADYGHADYGPAVDRPTVDYGHADYGHVDNGHADYGHADHGHAVVEPPVDRPTHVEPPVDRPTHAVPPVDRPTHAEPPVDRPTDGGPVVDGHPTAEDWVRPVLGDAEPGRHAVHPPRASAPVAPRPATAERRTAPTPAEHPRPGQGAHRLQPRPRAGDGQPVPADELVERLTSDALVRPRPARPESGWRRALWELSGGRLNPGVGAAEQDRAELVHRVRTPLRGAHRIAVISVKGGVGKTTVSACLGMTFAELRSDRVLAVDANPDMGTLADRLTGDTSVTVQHLLDHLGSVDSTSISGVDQFVSAIGRLHVLAGGQEPCDGQAFTRDEYEEAIAALSACYNVLITDSGTGVNHSAMEGTIAAADGVVIVGAPTVDAASRASMTLKWLDDIGRGELARQAVVALSLDRGSRDVDKRTVVEHFVPRCRAVVEIPADPHLATGGRIDLGACRPATRSAFLVLAAELTEAFPSYRWD